MQREQWNRSINFCTQWQLIRRKSANGKESVRNKDVKIRELEEKDSQGKCNQ